MYEYDHIELNSLSFPTTIGRYHKGHICDFNYRNSITITLLLLLHIYKTFIFANRNYIARLEN